MVLQVPSSNGNNKQIRKSNDSNNRRTNQSMLTHLDQRKSNKTQHLDNLFISMNPQKVQLPYLYRFKLQCFSLNIFSMKFLLPVCSNKWILNDHRMDSLHPFPSMRQKKYLNSDRPCQATKNKIKLNLQKHLILLNKKSLLRHNLFALSNTSLLKKSLLHSNMNVFSLITNKDKNCCLRNHNRKFFQEQFDLANSPLFTENKWFASLHLKWI